MLCEALVFAMPNYIHLYQSGAVTFQFHRPMPLIDAPSVPNANAVRVPNAVGLLPALICDIARPTPMMLLDSYIIKTRE